VSDIRVLQMGLGPIGLRVTRYLLERGGFEVVAAVDADMELIGRDLGDLAGLSPMGVEVNGTVAAALEVSSPQVAIVTTTSSLARFEKQIPPLLRAGLSIVSTCEELAYPWTRQPEISRRIDAAATEAGVAVLGTGVNPGFLMDFLPVALSGVCQKVTKITVWRVQDAQFRRIPFQRKIGAGLAPEAFQAKVDDGSLRHVGLTESMHMIAAAMGWDLTETTESIDPVMTTETIRTSGLTIEPGQAMGVAQTGKAYCGDELRIELLFRAAVGEPESFERLCIDGDPTIDMRIAGGVNGDVATGAIVVNATASILDAQPGLRTMIDVSPVCYKAS